MTALERQHKTIKHAPKHKHHGEKRKKKDAVTLTPVHQPSDEELETQLHIDEVGGEGEGVGEDEKLEADDMVVEQGQGEGHTRGASEGPSSGAGEGSSSGVAFEQGDREECNGGLIDKSVLKTFKDHIAYVVWHREKVFNTYLLLRVIVRNVYFIFNRG